MLMKGGDEGIKLLIFIVDGGWLKPSEIAFIIVAVTLVAVIAILTVKLLQYRRELTNHS